MINQHSHTVSGLKNLPAPLFSILKIYGKIWTDI
jgi:hypothetical protein